MVIISQSLNLWAEKEKNNSHFTGHHSSHNTNIYNPPYYYYSSYICQRGAEKRRTCNRNAGGIRTQYFHRMLKSKNAEWILSFCQKEWNNTYHLMLHPLLCNVMKQVCWICRVIEIFDQWQSGSNPTTHIQNETAAQEENSKYLHISFFLVEYYLLSLHIVCG